MSVVYCVGALLEKKVELDKRGLGMADYNAVVAKPLSCRPPPISKESSMDRPTFLDKVILDSFSCGYTLHHLLGRRVNAGIFQVLLAL